MVMDLIFPLPSAAVWRRIRSRLMQRLELSEVAKVRGVRTYYDTFDWRLYLAGEVLVIDAVKSSLLLRWFLLESDRRQADLEIKAVPRFAADLPAPVRERLAQRTADRALLPQATLSFSTQLWAVIGEDRKTLSRIAVEEYRLVGSKPGPAGERLQRLRLTGLKGYQKIFTELRQVLVDGLQAEPCADTLFSWAVTAFGHTPGGYSGKVDLSLHWDMPAEAVVRQICSALVRVMRANEPGVRAALDHEFLHDFRVAIRRLRSVLTQIKNVFPDAAVASYREEFAWLGQVSGPARDYDVYLANFSGYQLSLPEELRTTLEPLRVLLQQRQQAAQQTLVLALDSPRYRRLMPRLERFLAAPGRRPLAKNAGRPIGALASKRLRRLYRRICSEGRGIDAQSKPESLHELRKSCKKLRYLLEFFASLFPNRELHSNTKTLKRLQETLGTYQDTAVQSEVLQELALAMEGQQVAPSTLLAMGMLIAHLRRLQDLARDRFARDFRNFASAKSEARWSLMLDSAPVPQR